jgi:hypothetical protein
VVRRPDRNPDPDLGNKRAATRVDRCAPPGEVRAAAPKATLLRSVELLGLLLCFGVVSAVASAARAWSPSFGVLATLADALPYAALWLVVSLMLPHRAARWTALIPGALLFGLGIELLHVFIACVLTPWALAKQGTYGALGIAAALLVGLFLVSRGPQGADPRARFTRALAGG